MNPAVNVAKMHWKMKSAWLIAWSIMFSSFIINLIIGLALGGKTTIYTGGLSSIYIYLLILGSLIIYQTFPFTLGLNVRRKDYFLCTLLMAVGGTAVTTALLLLFSFIENNVIKGWGVSLHFFHLPYISGDSFLAELWTTFSSLLLMFSLCFVIGSVYQRFRIIGLLLFFGIVSLPLTIASFLCTYFNWWGTLFNWLMQFTFAEVMLGLLPLIVVSIGIAYMLIRRATA